MSDFHISNPMKEQKDAYIGPVQHVWKENTLLCVKQMVLDTFWPKPLDFLFDYAPKPYQILICSCELTFIALYC